MGVRWPTAFSTTIINGTLVTTAETIMATSPPINLTQDGALVLLFWQIEGVLGVGATAFQIRLRRGTLVTSPLVNVNGGQTLAASTNFLSGGAYPDSPGIVAEQQYTLTCQQVSATGNASINDAFIGVMVL